MNRTPTGSERIIGFRVGALAPSIAYQLAKQDLWAKPKDVEHWQRDADAINRLRLRGLIADSVVHTAGQRLMRKITKSVEPL